MLHQQVRLEKATVVRHVQEEDREFLYEMLKDMKIKTESASSVLSSAGLVFELGEQIIEAIVSANIYFQYDEAEFLSSMDQSVIDDMSFLDVKEQTSGCSDGDTYHSD